jgi:LysM repeat protein
MAGADRATAAGTGAAGVAGGETMAGEAVFEAGGEAPGQASLGMIEEPEPPAFLAGRSLDDGRPVAYQQVAAPATHRAPVGHAGLGAEQRTELERASDPAAPSWERPRRREAYPSLKTRAGFRPGGRGVPRVAMWAAILGIAVVVVFAAPFLFRGLGGSPDGSPSPSPTALASPTVAPTPTLEPVATPLVYTVKSGDTLSKIATKYKVTVDQILEANPKITNANRIQPGDKITIPTPPPDEIVNEGEVTPVP